MLSEEILRREQNEREAFSKVATWGRTSVQKDDELLVRPEKIERFRGVLTGAVEPFTTLEQMFAWIGPSLAGKRVLEICGHDGEHGALIALLGAAEVVSVDIAEPLVQLARRRAKVNGIEGVLRPEVKSVHAMDGLADGSFDIVFGKAALHHLDLSAARSEILRVLRPGGIAVFDEPVVLSPLLRKLRLMLPLKLDAESPDERPLSRAELDEFCRPFSERTICHARLFTRLDRLFPRAQRALRRLDRVALSKVPLLRNSAATCGLRLVR